MRLAVRHGLITILVLTTCIYVGSLRNGFVNLDDPILVTENAHVQKASFANIGYVFTHFDPELYIPVTFLTYQLETWILGSAAWHFHFFSLLLHLAAVWLVFEVVKRFTQSDMIALITALLFAVHPINSETVLWVSARKDVLSTVFFLASLLCFFINTEQPSKRQYWLSVSLFALGLLSKVTVVTLPIILILLIMQPKNIRHWLQTIGPFLILAVVFGMVAIMGKGAVEQKLHGMDFVLMAFRSTFFYLTLIIAQAWQSAVHSMAPHEVYSPLLPAAIGIIGCLSWIFFRNRKRLSLAWAGWIFFIVTLSPSFLHYTRGNENFMLGSERYAYLPSIGIFLIIAAVWAELWNRWLIKKPMKIIFAITSAVIILVLGYLTIIRTFVFENSVLFNLDILQKNPRDGRTWYNLGSALETVKQSMEAEKAYLKALELKPDLADAAINLGILFLKEGRTDEGMLMLMNATVIRPDYFKGYFNLGVAEQNAEKFFEAEIMYRKTIELFPDYPQAHRNLATVLGAQKKFTEAMAEYQILSEIDPEFRAEFDTTSRLNRY